MKLPADESSIWHIETHPELAAGLWIAHMCVHRWNTEVMLFIIEFVFSLLNSSAAFSTWTFFWYKHQYVKVNRWQVASLVSQSRPLQAKCICIATTLLWPTFVNIKEALQNQNCKDSGENIKMDIIQSIMHEKLWLWGSRYFGLLNGNWCCSKHFFWKKIKMVRLK